MGSMHAEEFAGRTGKGKGKISMDQALTWHLQGNHYPPVPISMVGAHHLHSWIKGQGEEE